MFVAVRGGCGHRTTLAKALSGPFVTISIDRTPNDRTRSVRLAVRAARMTRAYRGAPQRYLSRPFIANAISSGPMWLSRPIKRKASQRALRKNEKAAPRGTAFQIVVVLSLVLGIRS